MNQITAPPNDYDFGLSFNYSVWTPNTQITLTNVPWSNTYRDIVNFKTGAALNNFIDTQNNKTISNMSYLKPNQPIKLNVPYNTATKYNYVRASNPVMPIADDTQRDYYYFILGANFIAPNTTELIVELDVWATYGREVSFGNCYVSRGHVGVANSKRMNSFGRDYLTIPEGLDVGSDYRQVQENVRQLFNNNNTSYDVIITSTTSLTANPGTLSDPKIRSASGSYAQIGMPTESWLIKGANVQPYFRAMSGYPWVTQGIIRVQVIPKATDLDIQFSYTPESRTNDYPPGPTGSSDSYLHRLTGITGNTSVKEVWTNFRTLLKNALPEKYRHLDKFLTSPYSMIEFSTEQANHIMMKPELVLHNNFRYGQINCIVPGSERLTFQPYDYNDEGRNVQVTMANLPTLPVLNNNATLTMANQAHSTAAQYASADWSQQKALAGNTNTFNNTSLGIGASEELGRISRNADITQTEIANRYAQTGSWLGAGSNVVMGTAGGAAVGGPAGAAVGAIGGATSGAMNVATTAMNVAQANEALTARNSASTATQNVNTDLTASIRDNNYALSDFASRGDYQNTIGAMQAKTRDIQMIPPSLVTQVGGEFAQLVTPTGVRVRARLKMVDGATVRAVGDYWLRYGYAVNQFHNLTKLDCMTNFTYWQLSETYLTGSIPEFFKSAIRGIFEKGVTVWENPAHIGTLDISSNSIKAGITLA